MKKVLTVIFLLSILALCGGCGPRVQPTDPVTPPPSQPTAMPSQPTDPANPTDATDPTDPAEPSVPPQPTVPTVPEEPEHINISWEQLQTLQSLFVQPGNWRLMVLDQTFADPKTVNLGLLFYNGLPDEPKALTEQEKTLLEGKPGIYLELDVVRLPVSKMDAVLTELFGLTLAQTEKQGMKNMVYLAETDSYYFSAGGAMYAQNLQFTRLEKLDDGRILIDYTCDTHVLAMRLTLDANLRILSNQAV